MASLPLLSVLGRALKALGLVREGPDRSLAAYLLVSISAARHPQAKLLSFDACSSIVNCYLTLTWPFLVNWHCKYQRHTDHARSCTMLHCN